VPCTDNPEEVAVLQTHYHEGQMSGKDIIKKTNIDLKSMSIWEARPCYTMDQIFTAGSELPVSQACYGVE